MTFHWLLAISLSEFLFEYVVTASMADPRQVPMASTEAGVNGAARHAPETVSYTHLDVYKRQSWIPAEVGDAHIPMSKLKVDDATPNAC